MKVWFLIKQKHAHIYVSVHAKTGYRYVCTHNQLDTKSQIQKTDNAFNAMLVDIYI